MAKYGRHLLCLRHMGRPLCDIALLLLTEGVCIRLQKQELQGSPSCSNDLGEVVAEKVGENLSRNVI